MRIETNAIDSCRVMNCNSVVTSNEFYCLFSFIFSSARRLKEKKLIGVVRVCRCDVWVSRQTYYALGINRWYFFFSGPNDERKTCSTTQNKFRCPFVFSSIDFVFFFARIWMRSHIFEKWRRRKGVLDFIRNDTEPIRDKKKSFIFMHKT